MYQLIVMAPKVEDTGKYTIEIGGVTSTAYLNVEGIATIALFKIITNETGPVHTLQLINYIYENQYCRRLQVTQSHIPKI